MEIRKKASFEGKINKILNLVECQYTTSVAYSGERNNMEFTREKTKQVRGELLIDLAHVTSKKH